MNIPAALIALVVAISAAYMTGRVHGGDKVQAKWDKQKTAQMEQDANDAEASRLLARDRHKANERIDRDTIAAINAADARARARAVAGDGLRADLAALKGGGRDATPSGCAAVYDERDRLADLLEEGGRLLRECQSIGDRFTVQIEGLQRYGTQVCGLSLK